jgi:hypothetical protein
MRRKGKGGVVEVVWDDRALKALSVGGSLHGELAAGLFQIATAIMTESQENWVPVLTGRLKQSGTVLAPEYDGTKITVPFGYGEPYAEIVHDRAPTIGQGKVKYLEIPFLQALQTPQLKQILIDHVVKALVSVQQSANPTNKSLWKKYMSTGVGGGNDDT